MPAISVTIFILTTASLAVRPGSARNRAPAGRLPGWKTDILRFLRYSVGAQDASMLCRLGHLSCCFLFLLACAAAQDRNPDAPLAGTASDNVRYYLHRTYGLQKLGWLSVDTAIDHLTGEPEWGRGIGGYGCRYASSFGRRLITNSVELGAVLVLRQDTRFHRSHQTGLFPRLRYATKHAFLATGSSGAIEPAYARFAGIAGGALIAPTWRRRTLSGAGFGEDLAFSTLDQVQNSLLTEFTPDLLNVGRRFRKRLLKK